MAEKEILESGSRETAPHASLPLYALPENEAARSAFWRAVRTEVERQGITDMPGDLDFKRPTVPERIDPEMRFSQVCGYPLQKMFGGQAAHPRRAGLRRRILRRAHPHRRLRRASRRALPHPGRPPWLPLRRHRPPFQQRHEPAPARHRRYRRRRPIFRLDRRGLAGPVGKPGKGGAKRDRRHLRRQHDLYLFRAKPAGDGAFAAYSGRHAAQSLHPLRYLARHRRRDHRGPAPRLAECWHGAGMGRGARRHAAQGHRRDRRRCL